jgi:hypothetical protein
MYRFNQTDGRLDRLLDCCVLLMEALVGFDHKFSYALIDITLKFLSLGRLSLGRAGTRSADTAATVRTFRSSSSESRRALNSNATAS